MKKVLGLDLGTTSIGWAFVKEAENKSESSEILKLGVRIVSYDNFSIVDKSGTVSQSKDPAKDFSAGKGLSPNAKRTNQRGARRNLDRYQLRRDTLISVLIENKWITDNSSLYEESSAGLHESYELRARAVTQKITLAEFARVLLMINKKRGYKSARKAENEDDGGALLDEMDIAIHLQKENITPGKYALELLKNDKKQLPSFYKSDLENEFDKIWLLHKETYPDILTDEFYKQIKGKAKVITTKIFFAKYGIYTAKNSAKNKKIQSFEWRSEASISVQQKEVMAFALAEVNGNISNSSGYLGAISDRSKILITEKLTVGQFQYSQLKEDKHNSLKKQIFYRKDYEDEFETLWNNQSSYYEFSEDLKKKIKESIIFYQRPLKSQKGLISFCKFESKIVEVVIDGKVKKKTIGSRVAPRSSPLFQEFKIWQQLANIKFKSNDGEVFLLSNEDKSKIFDHLNTTESLTSKQIGEILFAEDTKDYTMNIATIDGNKTNSRLLDAFCKMIELDGYNKNIRKTKGKSKLDIIRSFFEENGIDQTILDFDHTLEGHLLVRQSAYKLWHLLYSYEGDNTRTGIEKLYKALKEQYGFERENATFLINVSFIQDYGSLSSKAIRKIFPYIMKEGYSDACDKAGYNHSNSLTAEENNLRKLADSLDILPKNSLRNPVVEKILNQMIHVVNAIIKSPEMGRPDEIRVELARDLKKSAKERAKTTADISKATKLHEEYRKIITVEHGIKNPTRNDIIRYKLYQELAHNGYCTFYTNTYVKPQELYSKNIDIEHIIPKALSFDDSFSNKTLAIRSVNQSKDKMTAIDFINSLKNEDGVGDYRNRVESAYKDRHISKAKYQKLLRPESDLAEGFIEREIRETQYISRKALQLLTEVSRSVTATTGRVTDRLREDWNLINVMKELNMPKYKALGMTYKEERKNNQHVVKIQDWTKRNDHRHHAMDALAVAFTQKRHIQYLNNLSAKSDRGGAIYGIEQNVTFIDGNRRRKFVSPFDNFREVAKKHLESILISRKASNKVATRNINKTKINGKINKQVTLTPRGQLHKETIYGKISQYDTKAELVNASFTQDKIATVANQKLKDALLKRLNANDNNPKKAFTGKNSLSKNPLLLNNGKEWSEKVMTVKMNNVYTIRKHVTPDLKIDKVIDKGVQRALQARLEEFGGNAKKAFVDLDENPIWLNKDKGISIKRVKITGISKAESLHEKCDLSGNIIINADGIPIPSSFVSTGNNHHVAFYKDTKGKMQENVVSLFEAIARVNEGLEIIDKHLNEDEGWVYQFNMKQNEYFLFPSEEFDPLTIDLLDPSNYNKISPNLFRVQKFTTRDYFFRHHLETTVEANQGTLGVSWLRCGLSGIQDVIKIRLNHLGIIVDVGDY